MTAKQCARCGRQAIASVCLHVSTVGISPRRQKCGTATLFCDSCIRDFYGVLRVGSPQPFYEAATGAYTRIFGSAGISTRGRSPSIQRK